MSKSKKSDKDKAADRFLSEVCRYLESKGWKVLVAGGCRIEKPIGSLEYNYELVVRFIGGKIR